MKINELLENSGNSAYGVSKTQKVELPIAGTDDTKQATLVLHNLSQYNKTGTVNSYQLELKLQFTSDTPIKSKFFKIDDPKGKQKVLDDAAEVLAAVKPNWSSLDVKKYHRSLADALDKFVDGTLKESTIAHYDEKSRQRNLKMLTVSKLVKKINDSTLPQDVASKVAKAGASFDGEITALDVKDILRIAGLSSSDKEEIMDLL